MVHILFDLVGGVLGYFVAMLIGSIFSGFGSSIVSVFAIPICVCGGILLGGMLFGYFKNKILI